MSKTKNLLVGLFLLCNDLETILRLFMQSRLSRKLLRE